MKSAIELVHVTKRYGTARGVTDLNLSVAQGEVFGFIGPNGAGKSTTIRMLLQLTSPTSGEIHLLGQRIQGERAELRRRIGYLPSEIHFYAEMTGKQALELAANACGLRLKDTKASDYAERLQWDMDRKIKSYSLGNRKKLGIVLSLLHQPELLILDEPTSGLDPLIQHEFFELLSDLKRKQGMTIFFSTHVLSEVEKLCERVAFIREGELVRISDVDSLTAPGDHIAAIRFAEEGNKLEAYGLLQLDPNAAYENGVHHLRTGSRLQELLTVLAEKKVREITLRKPTIEELFMDDYREERRADQ
ncbi:ABC transporter ATP-binding protein [Paenibacillus gansuensis]|uniref:ABC transporter ATP-binding protein n=1 Tax=Paenibacillus gansuensis TaxID=306542 RepID=A0ABW5PD65_9BACL